MGALVTGRRDTCGTRVVGGSSRGKVTPLFRGFSDRMSETSMETVRGSLALLHGAPPEGSDAGEPRLEDFVILQRVVGLFIGLCVIAIPLPPATPAQTGITGPPSIALSFHVFNR